MFVPVPVPEPVPIHVDELNAILYPAVVKIVDPKPIHVVAFVAYASVFRYHCPVATPIILFHASPFDCVEKIAPPRPVHVVVFVL